MAAMLVFFKQIALKTTNIYILEIFSCVGYACLFQVLEPS